MDDSSKCPIPETLEDRRCLEDTSVSRKRFGPESERLFVDSEAIDVEVCLASMTGMSAQSLLIPIQASRPKLTITQIAKREGCGILKIYSSTCNLLLLSSAEYEKLIDNPPRDELDSLKSASKDHSSAAQLLLVSFYTPLEN